MSSKHLSREKMTKVSFLEIYSNEIFANLRDHIKKDIQGLKR